jgi:pathogenesis-related protein 1
MKLVHSNHARFPILLLSFLLMLAPACAEPGKTGSTTPVADDREPVADDREPVADDREPVADDREPVDDPAAVEDPPGKEPQTVIPPTPPTPTRPGALQAEEQALLDHHNRVRADVSVAPLTWSDQLAQVAAAWGRKLVAKGCVMEHSKGSGYGENLYMGSADAFTMVDAGKSWESEKKHYTGAPLNGSNWYKSGHYTQMVWRQTTEVGCAKVTCKGSLIVICNYNPPGNFMGQKAY